MPDQEMDDLSRAVNSDAFNDYVTENPKDYEGAMRAIGWVKREQVQLALDFKTAGLTRLEARILDDRFKALEGMLDTITAELSLWAEDLENVQWRIVRTQ